MAISMSNIKKIIAIIKKWIENDIREDEKFLNPHSNGELLFTSKIDFFEIKNEAVINKVKIKTVIDNLLIIKIFSLN